MSRRAKQELTFEFPVYFPNESWPIEVTRPQRRQVDLDPIIAHLRSKKVTFSMVQTKEGFIIFRKWDQQDTDQEILKRKHKRIQVPGKIIRSWNQPKKGGM